MNTIVYVDGFNLYYGCLKNTDYKWLDLEKLLLRLCRDQDPKTNVISIKYFTAEISPNLSPQGQRSYIAQRDYLLALNKHCQLIEMIRGRFFICSSSLYPRAPGDKTHPMSFTDKVDVWRPEEKQTDVNIAIEMLCDAQDNRCEQQVLVTNDSDLYPLLLKLKNRYPAIVQGVISPIRSDGEKDRQPSKELKKSSNWIRKRITEEEVSSSALPPFVITRKRKISKPEHW